MFNTSEAVLEKGSELYRTYTAFRKIEPGLTVAEREARAFLNDSVALTYREYRRLVNVRVFRTLGLTLDDLADVDIRDGYAFADECDNPDRVSRTEWYRSAGYTARTVIEEQDMPFGEFAVID